jgi:hypothetical protein
MMSEPAQTATNPAKGPLWTKLGGALGFSGLPFYTSYFWVALMCGITLGSGRTCVMQGAVHLVVFAAFLFVAFVP